MVGGRLLLRADRQNSAVLYEIVMCLAHSDATHPALPEQWLDRLGTIRAHGGDTVGTR
jgi:hypothetical protein